MADDKGHTVIVVDIIEEFSLSFLKGSCNHELIMKWLLCTLDRGECGREP
jgi:hypothetical protein